MVHKGVVALAAASAAAPGALAGRVTDGVLGKDQDHTACSSVDECCEMYYKGPNLALYCGSDIPYAVASMGKIREVCTKLCGGAAQSGHVGHEVRPHQETTGGDHANCQGYNTKDKEYWCTAASSQSYLDGQTVAQACPGLCGGARGSTNGGSGSSGGVIHTGGGLDHTGCVSFNNADKEYWCTKSASAHDMLGGKTVAQACPTMCADLGDVAGPGGQTEDAHDGGEVVASRDDPGCQTSYQKHADFFCSATGDLALWYGHGPETIAQKCPEMCAGHLNGGGDSTPNVKPNPKPIVDHTGGGGGSDEALLAWKAPANSSCPRPGPCHRGGYGSGFEASFSWDIATGCWQETCVRDVDIQGPVAAFRAGDERSGFEACEQLMQKVYPMGKAMWEHQRGLVRAASGKEWDLKHPYLHGVMGFLKVENQEAWVECMNVPVHENTHVHHSSSGTFRPGNVFNYAISPPWETSCTGSSCQYPHQVDKAVNQQFPRRHEIWDRFPARIQKATGGPNYFKAESCEAGHEGGQLGCQRLNGIMTETEAYQHGIVASSWLSTAVGTDNSWSPHIVPPSNEMNNGAPFPFAFWSLANVYYLQHIASEPKYAEVWKNLQGTGSQDWRSIAELFLAHIDRATWYTRLSLDVNDMTDTWHQKGYGADWPPYKALSNECRKLQVEALAERDVLTPLRQAVAAVRGSARP